MRESEESRYDLRHCVTLGLNDPRASCIWVLLMRRARDRLQRRGDCLSQGSRTCAGRATNRGERATKRRFARRRRCRRHRMMRLACGAMFTASRRLRRGETGVRCSSGASRDSRSDGRGRCGRSRRCVGACGTEPVCRADGPGFGAKARGGNGVPQGLPRSQVATAQPHGSREFPIGAAVPRRGGVSRDGRSGGRGGSCRSRRSVGRLRGRACWPGRWAGTSQAALRRIAAWRGLDAGRRRGAAGAFPVAARAVPARRHDRRRTDTKKGGQWPPFSGAYRNYFMR